MRIYTVSGQAKACCLCRLLSTLPAETVVIHNRGFGFSQVIRLARFPGEYYDPHAGTGSTHYTLIRPDYWNSFVMAVMAEGQTRVDLCVERLCQEGCGKVTECINLLQAGEALPVLAHLEPTEVKAVLDELVAIMAAYEGSCKR